MDSSSVSLSSVLVEFQELPKEICNNQDIRCYFTITGEYTPHRLDKIHLCPVNYTSEFQEFNTWEFVSCRKTDNEMYPYEGEVIFSCEKYGFLVLENANATGYTLRYVNKDGNILGESNFFSIILEELESATLGISYVFLPNELGIVSSDGLRPESEQVPTQEPTQELTQELIAQELTQELTLEPTQELEPIPELESQPEPFESNAPTPKSRESYTSNRKSRETYVPFQESFEAIARRQESFEPDPSTPEPFEPDTVIPESFEPDTLIPESFETDAPIPKSEPTVSLFPLNLKKNEANRHIRTEEQVEFLEGTVKDLREQQKDLEERFDTKELECEQLTQSISELEEQLDVCEKVHKKGFGVIAHGLGQLNHVLFPDTRVEYDSTALANSILVGTEDTGDLCKQMQSLVEAMTMMRAEKESLAVENDKLKAECQNLHAVASDYKNQLILTNQEQAQISDKMTQLEKDQDILKTFEEKPTKPPGKFDRKIDYPPKARPRHLQFNNGHETTQSIVMTEPARGDSSRTFTSVKFLQSCSIHDTVVFCPFCDKNFEKTDSGMQRTRHVNKCMENAKKRHSK